MTTALSTAARREERWIVRQRVAEINTEKGELRQPGMVWTGARNLLVVAATAAEKTENTPPLGVGNWELQRVMPPLTADRNVTGACERDVNQKRNTHNEKEVHPGGHLECPGCHLGP